MERDPIVVVLAGGLGMRMRQLGPAATANMPKPMVEVGGRPLLWHIFQHYCHFGLDEFVVCLGHLSSAIKRYLLQYDLLEADFQIRLGHGQPAELLRTHTPLRASIVLAETGKNSLTATRVLKASRYFDGRPFIVTYGDSISDVDIHALLDFHRSSGKLATVTVQHPVLPFGELGTDGTSTVTRFMEKPRRTDMLASAGYFVFEHEALRYLDEESDEMLEQGPVERLVRDRQLAAYVHPGFWTSVETRKELDHLNRVWWSSYASGERPPWVLWGNPPDA